MSGLEREIAEIAPETIVALGSTALRALTGANLTIAVARGATRIAEVADASVYDFTSGTRRPQLDEIAVLRNVQGFYAAIHILSIKDDTRGADRDEVRIRFAIQPNGSPSFSAYTDDAMT